MSLGIDYSGIPDFCRAIRRMSDRSPSKSPTVSTPKKHCTRSSVSSKDGKGLNHTGNTLSLHSDDFEEPLVTPPEYVDGTFISASAFPLDWIILYCWILGTQSQFYRDAAEAGVRAPNFDLTPNSDVIVLGSLRLSHGYDSIFFI